MDLRTNATEPWANLTSMLLNNHNFFVFTTFKVSCQLSQNILSLLTLFWSPSLLSIILRRSSADEREPTLEFKSSGGLHSSVLKACTEVIYEDIKESGANRIFLFHTSKHFEIFRMFLINF